MARRAEKQKKMFHYISKHRGRIIYLCYFFFFICKNNCLHSTDMLLGKIVDTSCFVSIGRSCIHYFVGYFLFFIYDTARHKVGKILNCEEGGGGTEIRHFFFSTISLLTFFLVKIPWRCMMGSLYWTSALHFVKVMMFSIQSLQSTTKKRILYIDTSIPTNYGKWKSRSFWAPGRDLM